ncbi:outer membrane protein OmpA-like peptidoglycan-associated protein [Algoriphagus ratkowskyi]|uniref:OmpA family protein n=1 Tax=Algoriphagus ratkowskyi TaxID=57028 RepID=A0A2W7R9X8_9BACT|nr:OmpA family protein [Algoriphagus ratkowskyi]PZX57738.1 outer membrane protein OmpA-like peptidoglycan-associated protein [Algoriphagus ratkowskyi]TXD79005.1 OmpA family protein [Algoriphagus ratkowskyi]
MKKLTLLILAFAFAFSAQAQMHGFKWRFGVSAGTTNYYGDIRPFKVDNFKDVTNYYKHYKTYSDQLSYQISIEYALGNSVGLMLTGGSYQFGSSDRLIQNDGTLFTESASFDRALNFQTEVYDAGLSFVFKPDNNWLLSGKSFFAPYLTLGAGVLSFSVHGDLLDANGNRYNYTNPSIIPDGKFETNLSTLGTESSTNYETTSFYANVGLGVRFRITKSIEIFAQSDFKMTNTDYLDDVSGVYRTSYDNAFQSYAAKPGTNRVTADNPYRGMENGNPDWYVYHGMGIKFSLGANKKSFNPPVITQRYTYIPTELSNAQMVKEDSSANRDLSNLPVTNNYFTVIQLPGYNQSSIQGNKSELDSASLAQINFAIDSLGTSKSHLRAKLASAVCELVEINQTMSNAKQDTSVSAEMTQTLVQNLEEERLIAQSKLKTLNMTAEENQFKIDSLKSLQTKTTPKVSIDSVSMMKELIIYPGQVSRILYSSTPSVLTIDSATQTTVTSSMAAKPKETSDPETMTRGEFDEEMAKFRANMLSSQATRDSAMMIAFASRARAEEIVQSIPQALTYNGTLVDNTSKKQERLNKENNELLKDALLVGATATTTAAISNSGDRKMANASAQNDSILRARIALDSVLIDSLSNIPRIVDTVTVTKIQEKTVETLLHESKVEVYFGINEDSISDLERDKLTPIAEFLKKNPNVAVELVGFADNTGSVAYNISLTEKRVAAVTQMLTDYFKIAKDRIAVSNGGLIVRGSTKGTVEKDRKVEIRVVKK